MAEIPFATVEDLETRWRKLDDSETERAGRLLEDASVMMAIAMDGAGTDYAEPAPTLAKALVSVCCNMVKRVLISRDDLAGVTQYSQGAVGYTESMSYANPNGDMYITAAEKRMLGIGRMRIGSIEPRTGDASC